MFQRYIPSSQRFIQHRTREEAIDYVTWTGADHWERISKHGSFRVEVR